MKKYRIHSSRHPVVVEADAFDVCEGGLVLLVGNGVPVAAFAKGEWAYIEPVSDEPKVGGK
jgi:hypothetical protein